MEGNALLAYIDMLTALVIALYIGEVEREGAGWEDGIEPTLVAMEERLNKYTAPELSKQVVAYFRESFRATWDARGLDKEVK